MQKVLNLLVNGNTVRDSIDGYDAEDPSLHVCSKGVQWTSAYKIPNYITVLDALADGWRMLAPPVFEVQIEKFKLYSWWLVKD